VRELIAEFKAFAFRGNLLDLAAAVILGIAFAAVVDALVGGILLQIVAAIFGQPNFDGLTFGLGDAHIRYGLFLTASVNFLVVAVVLFFVVRAVNRIMRPRGAPTEPPETRECPYCYSVIPLAATRCSACTSAVEPVSRR
jgi:large conductance mechanosensitive channel